MESIFWLFTLIIAGFGLIFFATLLQSLPIWPDQLPSHLVSAPPLPRPTPLLLGLMHQPLFAFPLKQKVPAGSVANRQVKQEATFTAMLNQAVWPAEAPARSEVLPPRIGW